MDTSRVAFQPTGSRALTTQTSHAMLIASVAVATRIGTG